MKAATMSDENPSPARAPRRWWLWAAAAAGLAALVIGGLAAVGVFSRQAVPGSAFTGVARNADWEPVIREFDGMPMALVPAGCFMMGSEDGDEDELPVHEQCFDEPFWIGVTEVTYAQVGDTELLEGHVQDGEIILDNLNVPRDSIDWFGAADYCARQGARLPTEAEWAYAARGPDGLIFPWGNEFNPDHVAIRPGGVTTYYHRVEVGTYPEDTSWVGAVDMAGNVWEWTSSLYAPYPYDASDGREVDGTVDADSPRVRRGGSFFRPGEVYFRLANRYQPPPDRYHNDGGFRCARDVAPADLAP
jgi:formylglycine-generating enzyme required for sulfatase activity